MDWHPTDPLQWRCPHLSTAEVALYWVQSRDQDCAPYYISVEGVATSRLLQIDAWGARDWLLYKSFSFSDFFTFSRSTGDGKATLWRSKDIRWVHLISVLQLVWSWTETLARSETAACFAVLSKTELLFNFFTYPSRFGVWFVLNTIRRSYWFSIVIFNVVFYWFYILPLFLSFLSSLVKYTALVYSILIIYSINIFHSWR